MRDTSLNGTLFSVLKLKTNLTNWDTLLFETSPADVFITFLGKSEGGNGGGGEVAEIADDKTSEPDKEEESAKKCEGEEK